MRVVRKISFSFASGDADVVIAIAQQSQGRKVGGRWSLKSAAVFLEERIKGLVNLDMETKLPKKKNVSA